jgi:type IV secretory pathway TrbD component
MKDLSTSTYLGLFILSCILAAMVSIAVMQVVRTVEDVGPMIYIVGGAVAVVGILIPLMMVVMIRHLQKSREN